MTIAMAQTPTSPEFVSKGAYVMELMKGWPASSQPDEAQTSVDMRESLAESAVLPRESLYDRPPTPPPKDDPPKGLGPAPPNVPFGSRPGTSKTMESKIETVQSPIVNTTTTTTTTTTTNNNNNNKLVDRDLRKSVSMSQFGEIKIASMIPVPVPVPVPVSNQQDERPPTPRQEPRFNPLAMSPPSPAPSVVSKMPRRPARPASLRLSSLTSRTGLTTDKIVVVDSSRPGTSYSQLSQPHTGLTDTSRGTRVKYGRGKYATTELVPQPSDDSEDPLNWATWRKELNYYSLLMTVAMINVMKTALLSVNNVITSQLSCSYVAAVALTGVPLMISAGTGILALSVSKLWGRRPAYLVSMTLIFIGLVWNSQVSSSYGQFMAARFFQGLGWGAFEALMPGNILDTYFQHEVTKKMGIYRIVSAATLWGAPLLGGLTAQNQQGPTLQFAVLAVFQVVSIPLLVFGAPETMYNRLPPLSESEKMSAGWSPRTGWSSLGLKSSSRLARLPAWARGRDITLDRVLQYVRAVARPQSYFAPGTTKGSPIDTVLAKQPLRALVTPTALLVLLASFLPYSLLWGFAFALSGLFARSPSQLFPATVGSLVATVFVLSTFVAGLFSFWPSWAKPELKAFQTRRAHFFVLGVGAFFSFVGVLTFGLYVGAHVQGTTAAAVPDADANNTSDIRFSALSFILGLVAVGAYTLMAPTAPLVLRSTQFTSPNLSVTLRNVADMEAAVASWRAFFAGVFVMGIPAATVVSVSGLRNTGIGVAVMQVFVVAVVGAAWYRYEEDVWRWDGRILRCVDIRPARLTKSARSFFEADA